MLLLNYILFLSVLQIFIMQIVYTNFEFYISMSFIKIANLFLLYLLFVISLICFSVIYLVLAEFISHIILYNTTIFPGHSFLMVPNKFTIFSI